MAAGQATRISCAFTVIVRQPGNISNYYFPSCPIIPEHFPRSNDDFLSNKLHWINWVCFYLCHCSKKFALVYTFSSLMLSLLLRYLASQALSLSLSLMFSCSLSLSLFYACLSKFPSLLILTPTLCSQFPLFLFLWIYFPQSPLSHSLSLSSSAFFPSPFLTHIFPPLWTSPKLLPLSLLSSFSLWRSMGNLVCSLQGW